MSKVLLACTLLCSLASNFALADNVKDVHDAYPATVAYDGYSYTFWKTNTSIYVNSTKEDFKPCTISIDPVKDYTMKVQAKALSDHKFVLWGFRSLKVPQSRYRELTNLTYTVLIIDSSSCSYKAVSIPEEKVKAENWPFVSSNVLPYTNGFDFFSPSHGICSPCRFSLQGEQIPLEYQLEYEKGTSDFARNIQPVDENDLSKGYVFTNNNFGKDTAVIKLLDSKFKVVKQKQLQHPIHTLSVNSKKELIVSICYTSQNLADGFWSRNFKIHCEQLDTDFKTKLLVHLPVPKDQFVLGLWGITHLVDSTGNMYISLTQVLMKRENVNQSKRQLRLFISDKSGKLVETRDYETKNLTKKESPWAEMRSYFSVDKKFCTVSSVITRVDDEDNDFNSPAPTQELTNCVDVSKYLV